MENSVPHEAHDKCRIWENETDVLLAKAEVLNLDTIQELIWAGLKESIQGGWRTAADAEQLYYDWVNKYRKAD